MYQKQNRRYKHNQNFTNRALAVGGDVYKLDYMGLETRFVLSDFIFKDFNFSQVHVYLLWRIISRFTKMISFC